jgi:hypothetical protein
MSKIVRAKTSGITHKDVEFSVVDTLFTQSILNCQRSHETRIMKTKYLRGVLTGDQLVFHAVTFEGKTELLDGYTRCEGVRVGLIERPEAVLLITHAAKSQKEVERLYDQFNSPQASKKGRDRVQEGLRLSGAPNSMKSGMMTKGPVPTAAVHAVGGGEVRYAVQTLFQGMEFVDSLGLDKGSTSGGQLAAFLAIAQNVSNKRIVEDFIRRVHQNVFNRAEPEDVYIVTAREINHDYRANRATSGTVNVNALRGFTLGAFVLYYKARTKSSKAVEGFRQISLGEFLAWAEKEAA